MVSRVANACMRMLSLGTLGKFVSESKFQSDPAAFIPHIINKDSAALGDLITKPAVERALLNRIGKKASLYAADLGPDGERVKKSPQPARPMALSPSSMDSQAKQLPTNDSPVANSSRTPAEGREDDQYQWKVDIDAITHLYEKWIIPLTKEVEVST